MARIHTFRCVSELGITIVNRSSNGLFFSRRAKKRTNGPPRSCRRRRTRGAGSTTSWCATYGRPEPCNSTWPRAARCGTCHRSWTTLAQIRTTRSTRTWSSARTVVARSTRHRPKGTCRCALNGSEMQPPGRKTKNDERREMYVVTVVAGFLNTLSKQIIQGVCDFCFL